MRERPVSVRPPVHATRDADDVDRHVVHVDSPPLEWVPASNLDAPEPRPGYVQRWIRDLITPDSRDANWMHKHREGWRPRDPATVGGAWAHMGGKTTAGSSAIRVGNMVLCEMPVQIAEQRARYYADRLKTQMRSAGADALQEAAQAGARIGMKPIASEDIEIKRTAGGRVPAALMED